MNKPYIKSGSRFDILLMLVILFTTFSCKKLVHPDYSDKYIYVSINELKSFYKGEDLKINKNNKFTNIIISGVIISDPVLGNSPLKKGLIVQEGKDGILIPLDNDIPGARMNDSVRIDVANGVLTSYNGNLAIEGISSTDVSVLSKKGAISASSVVIGALNNDFSSYAGSLVKVVGAQVLDHQKGEIYSGNKNLDDGTGGSIELHTEGSASFAEDTIPPFGTFTGIALYGPDSTMQIWMRDSTDIEEFIPSPYPVGFPEKFDTRLVKDHYASDNLELSSGNWTFDGVTLVVITGNRPINPDGTKGVQFNQKNADPEYLQMNFDVFKGASKVTILYGSYGSDPQCTWHLEYSTNEGASWTQIGPDVIADNKTAKTAEFDMDIKGKVRFRVAKPGLGADNNGRLNMDDFTIYNNQ